MDSETPNNAPINPVSPTSPPEPETPLSDVETPSESLNIPVSDNSSTPANVSNDTPVEAPAESPVAQPDSPSDAPAAEPASAPADPAVDSLIASAEAEAPAQSPLGAPAFSSSNLNDPAANPVVADSVVSSGKKKSKTPLLVALLLLLILGAGGAYAYFYTDLFKKPAPAVENNETASEAAPLTASALALPGNSLSDFDLAFLRLEGTEKNNIYSPLSIKYALAMLKDGSEGTSKAQIEALIGDYSPKAYLNSANRSLANAMFIQNALSDEVKPSYKETLSSNYNAEVILDPFTSPDNVNSWVSDKTLGIIPNMFDESVINTDLSFLLVNALAIDMEWEQKLQPVGEKGYGVYYRHENYQPSSAPTIWNEDNFEKISFNGKEGAKSAKLAANINRYDIIKEIGEDKIRETVLSEYNKWLENLKADPDYQAHPDFYDTSFDIETYLSELKSNYGQASSSTDFALSETETEKVFVKDLKEYDGSTLEYVGIMPKTEPLDSYVKALTAEKAQSLINSAKLASSAENFKDGVVTRVSGYIPFFKFNSQLSLAEPLKELGITDVFSAKDANLSGMLEISEDVLAGEDRPHIDVALHKADIDFSNDGIKAAAVTAIGGMGASGAGRFDYSWDVPVEDIDITFDKPFLFLIRDKSTGEVWFTGSVSEL